jgi:hypothetical protein
MPKSLGIAKSYFYYAEPNIKKTVRVMLCEGAVGLEDLETSIKKRIYHFSNYPLLFMSYSM